MYNEHKIQRVMSINSHLLNSSGIGILIWPRSFQESLSPRLTGLEGSVLCPDTWHTWPGDAVGGGVLDGELAVD